LPRWVRIVTGIYLGFTMLATLGFGLHYFIDLVVAFPFTLIVHALCLPRLPEGSQRRWVGMGVGAVLTAGWLLVLRFRLDWLEWSPLATGAAALATMVGVMVMERTLYWEMSMAAPRSGLPVGGPVKAAISPAPAS